jgi:hypothetical protein
MGRTARPPRPTQRALRRAPRALRAAGGTGPPFRRRRRAASGRSRATEHARDGSRRAPCERPTHRLGFADVRSRAVRQGRGGRWRRPSWRIGRPEWPGSASEVGPLLMPAACVGRGTGRRADGVKRRARGPARWRTSRIASSGRARRHRRHGPFGPSGIRSRPGAMPAKRRGASLSCGISSAIGSPRVPLRRTDPRSILASGIGARPPFGPASGPASGSCGWIGARRRGHGATASIPASKPSRRLRFFRIASQSPEKTGGPGIGTSFVIPPAPPQPARSARFSGIPDARMLPAESPVVELRKRERRCRRAGRGCNQRGQSQHGRLDLRESHSSRQDCPRSQRHRTPPLRQPRTRSVFNCHAEDISPSCANA